MISDRQNTDRALGYLAAQRRLYDDARIVQVIQLVLTIPCVILFAVLASAYPGLKVYAAGWGITVAAMDICLFAGFQRTLKTDAAKIQELFDCEVLDVTWNPIKVGSRPDHETVVAASARYKPADPSVAPLKDWYPPDVDQLPIHVARLVCQRANLRWDSQLRRRYVNLLIVALVLFVVLIAAIALQSGMTAETIILLIMAPSLPAVTFAAKQYYDQTDAAAALERIKDSLTKTWERALNGANPHEIAMESRLLQDEIYDRRKSSPLIFSWIYDWLRNEHEEQMTLGADDLIKEAQQRLTPQAPLS